MTSHTLEIKYTIPVEVSRKLKDLRLIFCRRDNIVQVAERLLHDPNLGSIIFLRENLLIFNM